MKVEKSFTINGEIVNKEFQKGDITVYSKSYDNEEIILYFVNTKTEFVLFKQTITADCNQNVGFIDKLLFEGL